ncbi:MAG: hypothetical protein JWP31_2485 [Aeromicrobium sp.]|nr:hypothetical protein [Aeromicrobium sp.]
MSPRPLRRIAALTSTCALVAGGIAAATGAAQADPGDVNTMLCPGTPVWTGGFTEGQPVHGLTTTKGTTPEEFTGTYVATQADTNGNDIYLFDLAGSRITHDDGSVDAGIWAGISGSPVYDADDNLIGSVSYGFSDIAGSTIAGITPATNLLETDTDGRAPAVALSAPTRTAVAASGEPEASTHTLKRLSLQRVTVGDAEHATRAINKSRVIAKRNHGKSTALTSAGLVAAPIASTIVPGGSIGTTWSYGSVPLAAVGTVTAVCEHPGGDRVYAFGHPDENVGRSTQTFLSASTSTIVANGGYSYKMVNLAKTPEGPLVEDGNNGVVGVLGGTLPQSTLLTSTVTGGTHQTPTQTTRVSTPYALPLAIDLQVSNQIQNAFKNDGRGEALLTWTIGYTPRGGAPATYTRTQRVTSAEYYAYETGYEVASDVEFLQNASSTDVTIDSVNVSARVVQEFNLLRIARVDYRRSGRWVKAYSTTQIPSRPGSTLRVLLHLKPAKGSTAAATTKQLNLTVPSGARAGALSLSGGLDSFFDEDEFLAISMDEEDEEEIYDDEGFYVEDSELTLPDVLTFLTSQRRYDSVRSSARTLTGRGPRTVTTTRRVPSVAAGHYSFRLRITG